MLINLVLGLFATYLALGLVVFVVGLYFLIVAANRVHNDNKQQGR